MSETALLAPPMSGDSRNVTPTPCDRGAAQRRALVIAPRARRHFVSLTFPGAFTNESVRNGDSFSVGAARTCAATTRKTDKN
jgi:hypothetical protein